MQLCFESESRHAEDFGDPFAVGAVFAAASGAPWNGAGHAASGAAGAA